jgi:hypothetical protein
MGKKTDQIGFDIHPVLKPVLDAAGLKPKEPIGVGLPMEGGKPVIQQRNEIIVDQGEKATTWEAPGLRDLFRGNAVPPSMERYPEEYVPCFAFYEQHFLTACQGLGDRTDQEMEEVYAMLRRRPDGKSMGVLHDFLWQVSALLLALRPLSAAEFEAVVGRLERSARTWALRPVSRNYIAAVRDMFSGRM